MTQIHEFAPAKLNLYLHITGRRVDGYHNLDSLTAFSTIGDEVILEPDQNFSLSIRGPQASSLLNENRDDNLIVKAAKSLAELTGHTLKAHLTLVKNLPVASGIGGGSSDAAAALRALSRYWTLDDNDPRIIEAAKRHGQDVPLCVKIENRYITADGVSPAPRLPSFDVVLVNPNKELSTPAVYSEYRKGNDPFSPLAPLTQTPETKEDLVAQLKLRNNDLFAPAHRLMPELTQIIDLLYATPHCCLARMSGSGATCFAFYPDAQTAKMAASNIKSLYPSWWVEVGKINA